MGQKSTKHINEVMNETVAKTETPPAIAEANKLLQIKRNQIFIEDDSFIGDPYSLLGRVIEVRSKNGKCDKDVNNGYAEFSAFPIPGVTVNENSKIKQPLKTKSFIVDKKLSTEVAFLSFLNSKLDNESLFSVIVYDQAVGLLNIQDPSYLSGMRIWIQQNDNIINDPEICHLLVVTGMVQKNIIRKKYKKFEVKAKGGAYGLSVNGNLYTSTEDYSLDMRFGLSYQRIPIPNKTDILKQPTVSLAKSQIATTDIDNFLTLRNSEIKGIDIFNSDVKTEFVEKLLLPNEDEINFIDNIQFKK
ncbi:hypothetical protein C7H62_0236 [Mesoflavibacter sp. HG96]|uniref:hypothetical protein n=1 Tax=Mesoflavibacter TaxID=444051 RepID=UPI000D0F7C9B|nr:MULTISPECIES: hypothetical protein [Mesoflavibacter]QIJ88046.1 hypothetical protein C7H62_0236 [Mesoflavibacter sp. HG96]QIJ90774.1 hypothetical protein C7H56_0236 [Mesoflavibacter sp. HG37]